MEALAAKREIGIITAEIITIRENTNRMVLENSIEIGRRLLEAKEVVGHGSWGDYLRERVNFSPSTANNLMKLCQEYGDTQLELGKAPKSQTFGNLTYSQAVALLALPEDAREEVVAEHDMENTSVRELQAIIEEKKREADAAREEAEKAKEAAADALRQREQAQKAAETNEKVALRRREELEKQTKELRDARAEIKRLESQPVEIAVQPPSQKELEAIRREAKEEITKKLGKEIDTLRGKLEETRQAGEQQTARAAELEKKLAVAGSSETIEFNLILRQFQEDAGNLRTRYFDIRGKDAKKAEKLRLAVGRLLQMMAKEWEH